MAGQCPNGGKTVFLVEFFCPIIGIQDFQDEGRAASMCGMPDRLINQLMGKALATIGHSYPGSCVIRDCVAPCHQQKAYQLSFVKEADRIIQAASVGMHMADKLGAVHLHGDVIVAEGVVERLKKMVDVHL
ncbi:hypothetical protein SDC9_196419 [bioreactor metagenome]|uniref:Uncharacterized protein n=1 Tax=bioreactor metagenome TaxID=1076179 RepID=A0A645IC44_9ZZZZ